MSRIRTNTKKRLFFTLLPFLLAAVAFAGFGCHSDNGTSGDDIEGRIAPHKEVRGRYLVVWLAGTPYEMGYQHGSLLHDEFADGIAWLEEMHLLEVIRFVAEVTGILDLAWSNSYPEVIEECEGLVDATADFGMTMDVCLLLNFGDVLVEFLEEGMPPPWGDRPGCSQVAAVGPATRDGRLYHGRVLDWSKIDFLLDYPVVFVRQPDDGLPHAFIGFPGNLSPYSGINAAGLSIASNEADPLDRSFQSRTGRSHVQMLARLLRRAHSLEEAREMIISEAHMSTEIIVVADGVDREAAVFEMTAKPIGVREMESGIVYTTNHFVAPETVDADECPAGKSSLLRFDRLTQLIEPDGEDTRYGEIDPGALVEVLRDRINPWTGEESAPDEFDNNESIATNGALYEIVFDPEALLFWVAAGAIPVPQQPFVCFSLGELLERPDAVSCEPEVFE